MNRTDARDLGLPEDATDMPAPPPGTTVQTGPAWGQVGPGSVIDSPELVDLDNIVTELREINDTMHKIADAVTDGLDIALRALGYKPLGE